MKQSILKIAIGALMLMGSGMASAGLLGASVSFSNGSVDGDLVSITAIPTSTTVTEVPPLEFEFAVCVDGPATGCPATGLKFTIDIDDASIVFAFTGSTGPTGTPFNSFFFDLVFASNVTITAVDPDTTAVGNDAFGYVDFVGNVINFQGTDIDSDGAIDAGAGATITLQITAQQTPEPGALALLGLALAGMGFARRRVAR